MSFSHETHSFPSLGKKKKIKKIKAQYWLKLPERSLFCGAFNKRLDNPLEDKQQSTAKTSCGARHWGNWMKSDGPCSTEAQTRGFVASPCLKLREFRKSKAEKKRLEEKRLLCSSRTFYTNSYRGSGSTHATSRCPAAGREGSGEGSPKQPGGGRPSQAAQVRSACRGFGLMHPSQSTPLLSNAACGLWSLADTGTKSDVLQSN